MSRVAGYMLVLFLALCCTLIGTAVFFWLETDGERCNGAAVRVAVTKTALEGGMTPTIPDMIEYYKAEDMVKSPTCRDYWSAK